MLWCNLVSFSKFLASYPRTQVLLPPKVPGMSVLAPAPSLPCVAPTLGLHHAFTSASQDCCAGTWAERWLLQLLGCLFSLLKGTSPFSRNAKASLADLFPVTRKWLSTSLNKRESHLSSLSLEHFSWKLLAKCYPILKYSLSLKIVPAISPYNFYRHLA